MIEINFYDYWYCMFVIMIAMVIQVLTSLLALFGTFMVNNLINFQLRLYYKMFSRTDPDG